MIHLICGCLDLAGRAADLGRLERMAKAMVPDGHDGGTEFYTKGPLGLAVVGVHKPNPFSKPEMMRPPEIYEDERCVVVADIKVYNFRINQNKNNVLEHVSDVYKKAGIRGLDSLDGDFTLALWDKRSQSLLFKRDHVGVRPAYYAYEAGKALIFASLGKAVRANGMIANPLEHQAQIDHLATEPLDNSRSFHKNLKRLPGGHEIEFSHNQFKLNKYWELEPAPYPDDTVSFEDWSRQLREKFKQAVIKRLPTTGPIASHLSSGFDSASISAVASQHLPHEDQILDTYTFAMSKEYSSEDMLDEAAYAGEIAKATNRMAWTKVHAVHDIHAQPIAIEEDRDAEIMPHDQENKTAEMVASKGSNVILSGWGGDEVVTYTGTGALAEMFSKGNFKRFWTESKKYAERRNQSLRRVLINVVGARLAPASLTRFIKRRFSKIDEAASVAIYSGFKPDVNAQYVRGLNYGADTQSNRLTKFKDRNLQWELENWAYMGARHGVQYVFPMLDLDLLKFAMSCPPEFLVHDGYNRAAFRKAMTDYLPETILKNRWKHFAQPCSNIEVIRNKDHYLDELDQLSQDIELSAVFDFDAVRQRLLDLPSEKEERARLAEWGRIGEQGFDLAGGIVSPIANMKKYKAIKDSADRAKNSGTD